MSLLCWQRLICQTAKSSLTQLARRKPKDSELKAWLGAMELDIRNVAEAWDLLQDECLAARGLGSGGHRW